MQDSLEKSRVFVDEILKNFRNANQYQVEDVMEWSVYMEHFQSVLPELDDVLAAINNLLI